MNTFSFNIKIWLDSKTILYPFYTTNDSLTIFLLTIGTYNTSLRVVLPNDILRFIVRIPLLGVAMLFPRVTPPSPHLSWKVENKAWLKQTCTLAPESNHQPCGEKVRLTRGFEETSLKVELV